MDLGQIAMLRKGGFSGPILMPATRDLNAGSNWRKLAEFALGWLKQRYPVMSARLQSNRLSRRLASGLARLQKVSA